MTKKVKLLLRLAMIKDPIVSTVAVHYGHYKEHKFLFMFSPAATAASEIAIIVLPVPISALITPAG
jgi:hypothetical protein